MRTRAWLFRGTTYDDNDKSHGRWGRFREETTRADDTGARTIDGRNSKAYGKGGERMRERRPNRTTENAEKGHRDTGRQARTP